MAIFTHQSFTPSKGLLVPALGLLCSVLLSTGCVAENRPEVAAAPEGTQQDAAAPVKTETIEPAAAAPAAAPAETGTYTVKPGDTLTKIALAELGSKDRWQDIKAVNEGLNVTKPLTVGQILNMPAK
jgi:nucleoid-associated protein YgaU